MKEICVLKWNNKLRQLCVGLSSLYFVLLCAVIITKQEIAVVIVLFLLLALSLILTIYILKYKIVVYSDNFVIHSLFKKKEFLYQNCIIKNEVSIRVFDVNYEEKVRIASFLDTKNLIFKSWKQYCQKYKINYNEVKNNVVKYNYYVKNFSVFGIVFSTILIILASILLCQYIFNIYRDLILLLFFTILGVIVLAISVIGLLNYKNFRIVLNEEKLNIKNCLNRTKVYLRKDLDCQFTSKIIRIYFNNKKIKSLLYYFLDNVEILN